MIAVEKWAGLVTNASPYAIPPGAAVTQVNLQAISPGQLAVRPGLTAVTYAGSTGGAVRSAMRYPGSQERVMWQDSSGGVYVYTA